jgi:cellulose synthase/poly-beta-1,6-N-acetylglucosamine synthase-like glycosyltransferase
MLELYIFIQILYIMGFMIDLYLFSLPVSAVNMAEAKDLQKGDYPYIVLFYPVLKELEETMCTTFTALETLDYPKDRYRVISIPNANDTATVESLMRLKSKFAFLEVLPVPPTSDPSWEVVWKSWDSNPKVYWWHSGLRAYNRDLPPKKTRQLIYAFYSTAAKLTSEDFLVNYIDADSAPPRDHFLAAAIGMRHFDVLQSTNIAGNLLDSMAATWHAADHMAWDGLKYRHLSNDGRQPFWVLGKGLFFRASDLVALGGFHPWTTIEDPEVGMRFWVNGKRLGIIENPLIEEVPITIKRGITQRKRWVAGFFQSLTGPLSSMGFTPWQRFKCWLIFLPCLLLSLNAIGIPVGIWALWAYFSENSTIPLWAISLAVINFIGYALSLTALYISVWKRSALVLNSKFDRLRYLVRINPISLEIWWLIWLVPLWIGFMMYLKDGGLVWERTEKINANESLVRKKLPWR